MVLPSATGITRRRACMRWSQCKLNSLMCNVPPTVIYFGGRSLLFSILWGGGVFRVMRCPPNALGNFWECFTKRLRTMRASISAECLLSGHCQNGWIISAFWGDI